MTEPAGHEIAVWIDSGDLDPAVALVAIAELFRAAHAESRLADSLERLASRVIALRLREERQLTTIRPNDRVELERLIAAHGTRQLVAGLAPGLYGDQAHVQEWHAISEDLVALAKRMG